MHIEILETYKPDGANTAVEDYLVDLDGTMHNGLATQIFCAASVWAYSDLQTFASMMCHRGLYGEFVSINVTNEPTFVDTTAFLFLSKTKRLAVLAFRGTEPLNIINWLADINTKMVAQEEGQVHGGFLTASLVLLPILRELLLSWSPKDPSMEPKTLEGALEDLGNKEFIPREVIDNALRYFRRNQALRREVRKRLSGDAGTDDAEDVSTEDKLTQARSSVASMLTPSRLDATVEHLAERVATKVAGTKPALYICGHSLGGAFAGMAGAMLLDPTLKPIREKLRSIYTFGAPMFADTTYADTLERELGKMVFRHRYGKDITPLLPGRHLGDFKHFGYEYVNSRDGVWVRKRHMDGVDKLVYYSSIAILIGFLAWLQETAAIFPRIPLPYSFPDHYPLRYLRTSQAPRAGWEILGSQLVGDLRP